MRAKRLHRSAAPRRRDRIRRQARRPVLLTPRRVDVLGCRVVVTYRQVQREAALQDGARKEDFAGGVYAFQDLAVFVVGAPVAETDDREGVRRGNFKTRVGGDFPGQVLRHADVAAHHLCQAFAAEPAQDEPELQGAEAPTERHAVIHQVDGAGVLLSPQIFGDQGEGAAQHIGAGGVKNAAIHGCGKPLVWVGDEAVGAVAAFKRPAELGRQGGGTGVGGVYVQPDVVLTAEVRDGGNGIDAGGGSGPDSGGDAAGAAARGKVALDQFAQGFGAHAELVIHGDLAHVILADADGDGAFFNRRVRLFGSVDHQSGEVAAGAGFGVGEFAGGGDGVHAAGGSGVVDHAEPVGGKAAPFAEPAEHYLLQFGDGRGGLPQHAVAVEGGGEEFAQDAFAGGGVGEVGQEAGVVPVRHGGDDEAPEIGKDDIHGLAVLGA